MMRKFETPYIADWYAVSLRWLFLVSAVIALSAREQWIGVWIWPLVVLSIWNIALTIMAGTNRRLRYHRFLIVGIDLAMAGLFFWLQGGMSGPAMWTGILPVLSGALYFELWGALTTAALISILELANVFLGNSDSLNWLIGLPVILVTIGVGVVSGLLSHKLIESMRETRLQRLDEEDTKRRVEAERLRAIYSLSSTLTETLNYRLVLESAIDLSASALNPNPNDLAADRLVSAVMLFQGNQLQVQAARRFTNADMRVALEGSEGFLKKVLDEGDPLLTTDVSYDPELSRIVALRSCTSVYCFPLRSGFSVYGVMLFAHPDPNFFIEDRREILDILGRQTVIAIQNARLYQDLVEEKERMIEVHEEARKKLARDLHDGPTQSVSAMAMRLNIIRRMLEKDPKSAGEELVKVEDLARRTTKEIRHMLFTLRPLILESRGLVAALNAMAEKMNETYGQKVVIEVDERQAEQLEMGKQGVIFYLVEEAVNNARKHAKANLIQIRLNRIDPGLALLEIKDDGIGFDVKAVTGNYDQRGSLGMVNLGERTELINGLLHIDSVPGKGTNVQIYIPLTEEAADRLRHNRK
jgi:signal transduction histidine kinase